jgi:hypothetical protein
MSCEDVGFSVSNDSAYTVDMETIKGNSVNIRAVTGKKVQVSESPRRVMTHDSICPALVHIRVLRIIVEYFTIPHHRIVWGRATCLRVSHNINPQTFQILRGNGKS